VVLYILLRDYTLMRAPPLYTLRADPV